MLSASLSTVPAGVVVATVWLGRITHVYPAAVWLNPVPEAHWGYTQSVKLIKQLMNDRMYPLSLDGLDKATRELTRKH